MPFITAKVKRKSARLIIKLHFCIFGFPGRLPGFSFIASMSDQLTLWMMENKDDAVLRKLNMDELNRLSPENYRKAGKLPLTVVLDNIRSCHNIGSVFRTSDALLVEKIWLCGITATPPNKEIHKTALDAEKSVLWEYAEDTLQVVRSLHSEGYKVFAIEQVKNSISLPDFRVDISGKTALVFGNELKGVQQEVIDQCDGAIEIPQFGTKHSFNISVSAGIVLWELSRQLQ
jgi:23S rRNA (guanosine2251-2'-O)-methyltransferase